ncbi:hypothetical protein [Actinoplanes philippinensis]|uniref:hypothetical protein n=1 Tax=Actinoplanes philippinensis TaxID=35752 RepID=UPI0033EC4313
MASASAPVEPTGGAKGAAVPGVVTAGPGKGRSSLVVKGETPRTLLDRLRRHAWSYSTPHCSPAYARIDSIRAPPTTS